MLVQKEENEKKSLRVKGFVYDTQRDPIPGVTVKVAGVSLGTATDTRGWFRHGSACNEWDVGIFFRGF